jgi:sec-independent protein translocase protein TatA
MRPPGPLEIVLIIVIVLIIFGAGKLPQIFEMAGKGIRALRGGKKSEEAEPKKITQRRKKKKSVSG